MVRANPSVLFAFIVLIAFAEFVHSRKILIFVPGYTDGQVKLFVRLGDLLTNQGGHQVTLFRPQFNPDVRQHDPKSTGVRELRYNKALEDVEEYRRWSKETGDTVYRETSSNLRSILSYSMDGAQRFGLQGCEKMMGDTILLDTLRSERFDLAVVEADDLCSYGMVRALAIPSYVSLSSGIVSAHVAWMAHVPSPVAFVPNSMSQFSDRMSLGQRVQNLATHGLTPIVYRRGTLAPMDALFRKQFGQGFPSLAKLVAETPIMFVNDEELIGFPRPILHKMIYIGGFSTGEDRPLSGSWKKLMDEAKDGVVLMSFGSVLKGATMPLKWKAAILNACSKYPTFTFVFQYNGELDTNEHGRNVTNLKVASWVPQERLLAHPKTKAFVTEGGLSSVLEAAKHGVPMLVVPLFGDQMGNRFRAQRLGVAVGIEKKKFKTKRLIQALDELLNNRTFKANADRLARMIRTKPIKPHELALGWIDFVAEYKTIPNLRPASLGLSYVEYFMLDALLVVSLIAFIVIYVLYRIFYCYYWRCCETSFHEKTH